MTRYERPITKEQYERAQSNGGYITGRDSAEIFTESEREGYGVYGAIACERNGEYIVAYHLGDSCD